MSKEDQKLENGGSGLLHSIKILLLVGHCILGCMSGTSCTILSSIAEHCFSPLTKSCILDCIDIEVALSIKYKSCSGTQKRIAYLVTQGMMGQQIVILGRPRYTAKALAFNTCSSGSRGVLVRDTANTSRFRNIHIPYGP